MVEHRRGRNPPVFIVGEQSEVAEMSVFVIDQCVIHSAYCELLANPRAETIIEIYSLFDRDVRYYAPNRNVRNVNTVEGLTFGSNYSLLVFKIVIDGVKHHLLGYLLYQPRPFDRKS